MMKHDLKNYEAVIFDLGGVVLDIDYHKTVEAFRDLGLKDFDVMYSQASQTGLFDQLETGLISSQSFVNQLKPYLPKGTSPNQIVHAWNAMILDFPLENLLFLQELKENQSIYLLSNTNEIHVQCFHRKLHQKIAKAHLSSYFHKVYFSNEIGLRKPQEETFSFVCSENNLTPNRTLFIDDSIQHIDGAHKIGLQTIHYQSKSKLKDFFSY